MNDVKFKSMKQPTRPFPQGGEGYIAMRVDFSNIDTNERAQQILLKLSKLYDKSEQPIRFIVRESMLLRAIMEIEVDKETLSLALEKRPDNTGFLNSNEKIQAFWCEVASDCSEKAVEWLRLNA